MMIILQVLLFLSGATIASFFQLLADRQPLGIDVVFTRSYCDSCYTSICYYDLLPILGYLLQRGRCRHCQNQINPQFLVWEFIGGFSICWWSFFSNDFGYSNLLIIILLLQLAIFDCKYFYVEQIYLSQLLFVIILLKPNDALSQALPALCCFIGLFIFSKLSRGLGMADVELLGMFILAYGVQQMLWIVLITNLFILIHYLLNQTRTKFAFIPYFYFAVLLMPLLPH